MELQQLKPEQMKPEQLTIEQVKKIITPLILTFPKNSDDFYSILIDRIIANKINECLLTHVVNRVIDNKHSEMLYVADIIGCAVELREENIYVKGE